MYKKEYKTIFIVIELWFYKTLQFLDINDFGKLWIFLLRNKYGEGGSKKFYNGTIWDEMGQNRMLFGR